MSIDPRDVGPELTLTRTMYRAVCRAGHFRSFVDVGWCTRTQQERARLLRDALFWDEPFPAVDDVDTTCDEALYTRDRELLSPAEVVIYATALLETSMALGYLERVAPSADAVFVELWRHLPTDDPDCTTALSNVAMTWTTACRGMPPHTSWYARMTLWALAAKGAAPAGRPRKHAHRAAYEGFVRKLRARKANRARRK